MADYAYQDGFQLSLHGAQPGLCLPAVEIGAVVGDNELDGPFHSTARQRDYVSESSSSGKPSSESGNGTPGSSRGTVSSLV